MYNFNETISRKGTSSVKHELLKEVFGTEDLLPMWVADMDIKTPDFIMDAIRERAKHDILGYTTRNTAFYQSIINWMNSKHEWEIRKEWISFSPGVVPALAIIVQAFTKPGDKIIVQPPVYFPFFSTVHNLGRQLINNELTYCNNAYNFDFEDLKKQIDSRTRMIIISSPHNPVGRVWKKNELEELAEICIKSDILIISDEIHSDIVFNKYKHTPIAAISETIAKNVISTYAPSKTFNLAGLSTSFLIIPNKKHKTIYDNYLADLHLNNGNIFGNVALESAYTNGLIWLDELIAHIESNTELVRKFAQKYNDKVSLVEPEATYLLWLDFRKLDMDDESLRNFIIKKAKLGLNPGNQFGKGGQGFQRMNVACSQQIVSQALSQLEYALNSL